MKSLLYRLFAVLLLGATASASPTQALAQFETFGVSFEYTRFGEGCRSPTDPVHPDAITVSDVEPVNVRCHAGGGHLTFEWPTEDAPDPAKYLTFTLAAEEGQTISLLETDTLAVIAQHYSGITWSAAYFANGDSVGIGEVAVTPDTMRHTFAFDPPVTSDTVEVRMYGYNDMGTGLASNIWIYYIDLTMQASNVRVNTEDEQVLDVLAGLRVYPNPLQSTARFTIEVPLGNHVRLSVYDLLGREVETLLDGWTPTGTHQVNWDASSQPNGLYLYRLHVGDWSRAGKLVVSR